MNTFRWCFPIGLALALLLLLVGPSGSASGLPPAAGDVGVTASNGGMIDCPACPNATHRGTLLTFDVHLRLAADNQGGQDFHIQIPNSEDTNDFQCFDSQVSVAGVYQHLDWTAGIYSQRENGTPKKYISWYKGASNRFLAPGDSFRFTVVYCGPANHLTTHSVSWVTTNDGNNLPGVPTTGDCGDRDDVPNLPAPNGPDDPGWKGTYTNPNTDPPIGFALINSVPAVGSLTVMMMSCAVVAIGAWFLLRSRAPAQ